MPKQYEAGVPDIFIHGPNLLNLLRGCGRLFDDADEWDLGTPVDVVLVATEDERFRRHYPELNPTWDRPRVGRDLNEG